MVKLLGNKDKGLFFVVSAPSGTGKNTLTDKLFSEFDCVVESISYTTRQPRKGEVNGKDYYFVSEDEFKKMMNEGDFLEYAEVFGHHYGTSKSLVEKLRNEKKHVVMVIDTQGAMKLKDKISATYIFIKPPSMEELKKRLENRKTDSEENILKRLSKANKELEKASQYDYIIINDDINIAYEVLRSIFIAEERRNK